MLGRLLFLGSLPVFLLYFVLFVRTTQRFATVEEVQTLRRAAPPAWRRIVGLVPFVLFAVIGNAAIRVTLLAWVLIQGFLETRTQRARMVALGLDTALQDRLARLGVVAAIAITMLAVGVILMGRGD